MKHEAIHLSVTVLTRALIFAEQDQGGGQADGRWQQIGRLTVGPYELLCVAARRSGCRVLTVWALGPVRPQLVRRHV